MPLWLNSHTGFMHGIIIGIIGRFEKIKIFKYNIGTHGTFDPISCHVYIEGELPQKIHDEEVRYFGS